ncbi:MAG: diacylglycerol kinase family lipid kinase [Planctomycetaceae bacterium]|nr:diacylglycerol kinase family lipid kinase [Planctomycetaceae bacterium]
MYADDETLVLWNPSAGSIQKAGDLRARLEEENHWRLYESKDREDAIECVREACEAGVSRLIVAGGDGTINSAVEGMMRSDEHQTILGILPLGTGNDFARSLGISLKPRIALSQLLESRSRPVDLVHLTSSSGERYFANMLTAGNTGVYMDHLTEEIKHRWGPFSYLRGVIDILQHLKVFEIEVTLADGREIACEALNVFVANGKMSGGGLNVCSQAKLDDGLIDLIIVRNGQTQQIASLTSNYLISDFLEHELIEYHQATSLRVDSRPPFPVTVDGDRFGSSPLEATVVHGRIQVLSPGL